MSLFDAANWAGLAIDSTCGGRGTCGKCRVRVLEGANGVTSADRRFLTAAEIDSGWRLACQAVVRSECVVEAPRMMGAPKAALLGYGRHVALAPNVKKVYLALPAPALEDGRSDARRLADALRDEGFEACLAPSVWRALPHRLRESFFQVTAVLCGDEVIDVEVGDTRGQSFGLALDVGTTTVVAALVNLDTGAVAAVESALNGQAVYGADVISRVAHTMEAPEGLAQLQARIVETVTRLVERLLASAEAPRESVYEAVVVGNATMLHLLLGIPPQAIAVYPFIQAVGDALTLRAADLGLPLHPGARVATVPSLGAYVGADVVAGMLATGLARRRDGKLRLYIDVGTNGEIVLSGPETTLATAAPAGPAFEGAQIRCGMRASAGAIEGVAIDDDIRLQTVGGGAAAIGICGSGLIDAVAELLRVGLLSPSGRLARPEEARGRLPDALVNRLVPIDRTRAVLLSSPDDGIVLTQRDVRALQYAKAAIATGVKALMERLGVAESDLDEVLLAGSFGSYINPASARAIGLVPWVPLERIVAVGNAAGEGAKMALVSFRERQAANHIAEAVEYVELSARRDFNALFTQSLAFPDPGGLTV